MNIHIEYQDPLRPQKAHKVVATESTNTNVDIEKHLIDNEERQKQQRHGGQQQQNKQDSVEARLLASIQEILRKPIFAGNLSTQSIEVLGSIFEKLHDLEGSVQIREQVRRLLQELANSGIDELNLLEKKIKQLISNELLRVVPASSTMHQADAITIRLLNHLSVNDFSSARETTTLLDSFLKSPSSKTYAPNPQYGNTLIQQIQDAVAFNNPKLNITELKEISLSLKERLAQPITPAQHQQLSSVMQRTNAPYLLAHVLEASTESTKLIVEGRQITIPKDLGFKPGEAFLFETTKSKESAGIYIHTLTREAAPHVLQLFSKSTIPMDSLLKVYASKNNQQEIAAILQKEIPRMDTFKEVRTTPAPPALTSQALMSDPTKNSLLQQLAPTPRTIENISFLNQFQELHHRSAPALVQSISQLLYTAETMLPHGATLKPSQEELLFKLLLANNLEMPAPKEIEKVLHYDAFKQQDRNLLGPHSEPVMQQLQQTAPPHRPMTAFETLNILQQLQSSHEPLKDHAALRTLIENVQTNLFDQNTNNSQNHQTLYWVHQQNIHKGRVSVKDQRTFDKAGKPKEGPIGFILETQTPNLGDVSINFRLNKEKVDLLILDSHGTHKTHIDSEREHLAQEFSTLGWELLTLNYGLIMTGEKQSPHTENHTKPIGTEGIDLQA